MTPAEQNYAQVEKKFLAILVVRNFIILSMVSKSKLKLHKEGWPDEKRKLWEGVKLYWKFRHDLYAEDDIVFLNDRVVATSSDVNEKRIG